MAHWLKVLRGLVKTASVIISIAFLINSINGIMSTVQLADGETIQQEEVEPGDFEINWENKTIKAGVKFNNSLYYDLEDIIIHISADICINDTKPDETNISIIDAWSNGIETDTTNETLEGQDVKSGETGTINVEIVGDEFINLDPVFDYIGVDPATWDITDIITNPSLYGLLNTTFKVYFKLEFSVGYAFGQYQLDIDLDMAPETFNIGLGI